MKSLLASVFALAMLGATAAYADVGVRAVVLAPAFIWASAATITIAIVITIAAASPGVGGIIIAIATAAAGAKLIA